MNEKEAVWKSQITVFDPKAKEDPKIQKIPLDEDETCTAFCFSEVEEDKKIDQYLVVACAQGLQYRPTTSADRTNIKVFLMNNGKFELRHKT